MFFQAACTWKDLAALNLTVRKNWLLLKEKCTVLQAENNIQVKNKLKLFPTGAEPPQLRYLPSFNRIWGAKWLLGLMQDLPGFSLRVIHCSICHTHAALLLHSVLSRCHHTRMTFVITALSFCSRSGPLLWCTKSMDKPVPVCTVFNTVGFDTAGVFRHYHNKVVTNCSLMCTYSR